MDAYDRELGELRALLTTVRDDLRQLRSDLRSWRQHTETRIARLESWRSWIAGGLAVLGLILGIVVAIWRQAIAR